MPSLSSRYSSRFAASGLLAERSRVNSSTAAVMASAPALRLVARPKSGDKSPQFRVSLAPWRLGSLPLNSGGLAENLLGNPRGQSLLRAFFESGGQVPAV